MIEEGEFMVARQRCEPERELGEIDSTRVFIHAIEATLGNEAPGMKLVIFVLRNVRPCFWPACPGPDQPLAERTASLHQECARPHGRVADRQPEDVFWPRIRPQSVESRLQRILDNRSCERTRGIMASGAPALVRRLQERRA
jgi:hypothetical protein